jgi:SAM-dependent methyltransferase
MFLDHFNLLLSDRFDLEIEDTLTVDNTNLINGKLVDKNDRSRTYQIKKGIPRMLDNSEQNYSDNFGLQWNKFKKTQFDSHSGLNITEERFWNTTKWNSAKLKGKIILEAGSGAGRFTEILVKTGATIISFDLSQAVDANYESNGANKNLFLFQGDIYKIPFPDNFFDYVFCHGVLQHTPDPDESYRSLFRKLKQGGKISIDYYAKLKLSSWSTPKYFWRPVTKKMAPQKLLRIIKFYIPIWLPIDTLIRKIPRFGDRILAFLRIPCWNYVGTGFSYKQRVQWAILDTFDALAPAYDFPKSKDEVESMVASNENATQEIFYGGNGIVANIQKK